MKSSIGEAFDPRHNSLNFLRLVLAVVVILGHALSLPALHDESRLVFNGSGSAELAVWAFFAISGFLIASSALRNRTGRFAWQRFLRIFPGFWVCLLLTAFVFGVIGWLSAPPLQHCGLSCYFHAPHSPVRYIWENLDFKGHQADIAGTPTAGVVPGVWNASTWTLFYEILCYALLAVLAVLGILRRRAIALGVFVALWVTMTVGAFDPALNHAIDWATPNLWVTLLLRFATIFMGGAIVYLYRDRIPDSAVLAGACAVVVVLGLAYPDHAKDSTLYLTPTNLVLPLFAYPLIWLGIHLPAQRIGARNDYSYGAYIYGFPVTQLLVIWGVWRWGTVPYAFMSVLATVPLAVGSWWLVEKHALRLKRVGLSDAAAAPPASYGDEEFPSIRDPKETSASVTSAASES